MAVQKQGLYSYKLVTSQLEFNAPFSTNMAISEMKGQVFVWGEELSLPSEGRLAMY